MTIKIDKPKNKLLIDSIEDGDLFVRVVHDTIDPEMWLTIVIKYYKEKGD